MLFFFNIFWGAAQLIPFIVGYRLLAVCKHCEDWCITEDHGMHFVTWWGVVGIYLSLIVLCNVINLCLSPGGDANYSWFEESIVRLVFAKIFQLSVLLINIVGIGFISLGIYLFDILRKQSKVENGDTIKGFFIYYVVCQSIIAALISYALVCLNEYSIKWLPITIVVMNFMNLPLLSSLCYSGSFCDTFGRETSSYFKKETDLSLLQNYPDNTHEVAGQQPQDFEFQAPEK